MNRITLHIVTFTLFGMILAVPAFGQDQGQDSVRGAHENLPTDAITDDLGITIPVEVGYAPRRYPAEHDFPTGPNVGDLIPEFQLPNQDGELIDFHADRDTTKAVIVFYRSAVW